MSRMLAFAAVLLLASVGIVVASAPSYPPTRAQLVEGHTVFTVISSVQTSTNGRTEFAAAVAVLVRETRGASVGPRLPGVMWFNDQYLVDPQSDPNGNPAITRYPCTGAVLATEAGNPDPRHGVAAFTAANYVESYAFVDPNDHSWVVDKWLMSDATHQWPVWSVAVMGNDAQVSQRDDGVTSCAPALDGCAHQQAWDACGTLHENGDSSSTTTPGFAQDPGANGMHYPCGGPCPALRYNAVLFFFLNDFHTLGKPKDHAPGSADRQNDASGCQSPSKASGPGVEQWACPGGNDDREGNSHPFVPQPLAVGRTERASHGGSADCSGDGVADAGCHATTHVDIYYDIAAAPPARTYRILDTQGSDAPYLCEQGSICTG